MEASAENTGSPPKSCRRPDHPVAPERLHALVEPVLLACGGDGRDRRLGGEAGVGRQRVDGRVGRRAGGAGRPAGLGGGRGRGHQRRVEGGDVRRVRRLGGDWPRRGVHRRRRGARASGRGGGDEEVGGLFRLLVLRELAGRLERLEDIWVGGLLALHPINQLVEDRPTEVAAGVEGAGEKLRPGLGRDDLGGEEAEGGDGLVQRALRPTAVNTSFTLDMNAVQS